MDLGLDLALIDALIVVEMVEFEQIKVFLQFNKLVLNVQEVVRKLRILALIVEDKEINKFQKKYQ